jgi:hypothetical protein
MSVEELLGMGTLLSSGKPRDGVAHAYVTGFPNPNANAHTSPVQRWARVPVPPVQGVW